MKQRVTYIIILIASFCLILGFCHSDEQIITVVPIEAHKFGVVSTSGKNNLSLLGTVDASASIYKEKIYYLDVNDETWSLCSTGLDGEGAITIYSNDSYMYIFPDMVFDNDNIYVSVGIYDRDHKYIDKYTVLQINLDGSETRLFDEVDLYLGHMFDVDKNLIYYCDSETRFPMRFSIQTGTIETLSNTVCQVRLFELDNGVLYFFENQGRPESATVFLCGIEEGILKREETDLFTKDDYNLWFNEGWMYFFNNRSRCVNTGRTVADLHRKKPFTQKEYLIASSVEYDQYSPPKIAFGKRGIFISNLVWVDPINSPTRERTYLYITFNGLTKKTLNIN